MSKKNKQLITMTASESRTDFFRRRRLLLEQKRPLILREVTDSKPLTTALHVPTIGEQVQRFTSLSKVGLSYDDGVPDDDFLDYLDDLPDRGLSPHEDPREVYYNSDLDSLPKSFVDKVKSKIKDKAPKKQSGPDQTPPIGEGQTAPQAKPEAK